MATQIDAEIEPRPADERPRSSTPFRDLLSETNDELDQWTNLSRALRIVVTGKTGAGKSTLLNGFVGEKAPGPFREGHSFDPGTLEVSHHKFTKNNVEVTVWDCPGLQDGTENEDLYLQDLKNKTSGDIDIMLYCISMEEVRFDGVRHADAMKKLTNVFERRVWKNTVIVLTFANQIVYRLKRQEQSNMTLEEKFEAKVEEWKKKIQQLLRDNDCTDEETLQNIQVVPAGFKKPSLPGRKYWLSNVWIAIFQTLKTEDAKVAVISLNRHRFRTDPNEKYLVVPNLKRPPPVKEEEFKREIEDHPIVISPDMEAYLHKVGAEIVAASSAGVVIGATIGGVVAGAASFGVGIAAGAGVGGIIGGGIGFVLSTLFRAYKYRKAKKEDEADTQGLEDPETTDVLVTPESTSDVEEQSESQHEE